jgi:hypothetical protein
MLWLDYEKRGEKVMVKETGVQVRSFIWLKETFTITQGRHSVPMSRILKSSSLIRWSMRSITTHISLAE